MKQLVFQDQQVDLTEWPGGGARFDDGKIGVLAANCYLVVPELSVRYLE